MWKKKKYNMSLGKHKIYLWNPIIEKRKKVLCGECKEIILKNEKRKKKWTYWISRHGFVDKWKVNLMDLCMAV